MVLKFANIFNDDETLFAICIRSDSGQKIDQNSACMKLCGVKNHPSMCKNTCFKETKNNLSADSVNSALIPVAKKESKFFRLLIFNQPNERMMVFHPLKVATEKMVLDLTNYGVTNREMVIVGYLHEGFSRNAIAIILNIKNSTLKTHIKNIHRKIPAGLRKRLVIPES